MSVANKFFISLDWLSVTFKEPENAESFLSRYASVKNAIAITPRFGYSWGRQSENGVCLFGNPNRPDMGVHISFSGSALRNVESNGTTARELLIESVGLRCKVTRLDLAKDAHDTRIDLDRIIDAGINNRFNGTAQTAQERRKNDGGRTLEIGARTSERFARIYDKAKEQKVDENWLRYEFELKGDVAKTVARVLVMNDTDWDKVFNTMAKKFFLTSEGNYSDWLQGGSLPGLPKIEKQADREAWIYSQVIKAVSDHLAEHPDSKAIEALYNAIAPYFVNQS